jgi:LacI family transcriptional regulator
MTKLKRIALLMGHDIGYCRGVMNGIHAYALDRTDWVFHDAPPAMETLGPLREWQPHGIIAHLFDAAFVRCVLPLKKPLVNVTSTFLDLPVPMVDMDNRLAGRLAAEHFLERGFRNFGFFGSAWTGFSKQREEGFREALNAAGLQLTSCYAEFLPRPSADSSWKMLDRVARDWLLAICKPAAILASNDYPARRLADMCCRLKLRVPEDVALLGIDNDELECRLANPPLSSVVNPAEKIGFEAASMLDKLMSGKQLPQTAFFIPPTHIITRQSTDVVAIADPDVSAAVAFISAHATESIGVSDVVESVAIARRGLERRFRKLLGRSIHQEIQRVCIDRAKYLLAETALPIAVVASRSGFSTPQRLATVFRQVTGEPPVVYRQQSKRSGLRL